MKKYANKSELGSVMIEALAMLALIALVTPLLYKKSAERATELQDINAAGELRTIIKAVDDYISANYDAITSGGTITNSCPGGETNNKKDYSVFKKEGETDINEKTEVPLGHFCEFLPYGILDKDGNVNATRLFSPDYKVVLKLVGTNNPNGDKVVTAFVVTDPRQEGGLSDLRASSIASMIGGNGGYVNNVKNEGEEETGEIAGNLGIWGISDTKDELGITVKKGAVVAASIQGISSQNAKLDLSGVLFREPRELNDYELNTMTTTLYMGGKGSKDFGENMVNIGKLIVGDEETPETDDRLYIKSGDIRIGNEGENANLFLDGQGGITVKNGDVTLQSGGIDVTGGNVEIKSSGDFSADEGNLIVSGEISAAAEVFKVASDGAVEALNYVAGVTDAEPDGAVRIHVADGDTYKTTINEPLEVFATGNCTDTTEDDGTVTAAEAGCALHVKGNALIEGNLTVTDTFSAKNLHAQEELTVGGENPHDSKALKVVYNAATSGTEGSVDTSSLDFGSGLFKIDQTGAGKGNLNFAGFVKMNTDAKNGETPIGKQFEVDNANDITMTTSDYALNIDGNSMELKAKDETAKITLDNTEGGSISMDVSSELSMNDEAFKLTVGEDNSNEISSQVKSFTIKPTDIAANKDYYFQVSENTEGSDGDKGQVLMKGINTFMLDTNQYLRGSVFHVQKTTPGEGENPATHSDVVRIAQEATSDDKGSQIEITGDKITAKETGNVSNNKVLKIDLKPKAEEGGYSNRDDNYPIYIRRGAIELREEEEGKALSANSYHNYVQADRFIANHTLENKALVDFNGSSKTTDMNYEINPAYTSVMHDIKLTTRGGARLSDILPDFINKGIYVVDNTLPARKETCTSGGKTLAQYKELSRANKIAFQNNNSCTSITQEVSPWAGFVPTPTCPPGYSKVITLTPASFAMAQAGIPYPKSMWGGADAKPVDLAVPYVVKSPYDYLDESAQTDTAPTPLYYQKNTWLKSFVERYPTEEDGGPFEGWDVGMGFIYPYNMYSAYFNEIHGENRFDQSGDGDSKVIWNLFPVYAGTLEGYATVYCYFNRGKNGFFNSSLVDTEYDQLNNFRADDKKYNNDHKNELYRNRLNDARPQSDGTGVTEW